MKKEEKKKKNEEKEEEEGGGVEEREEMEKAIVRKWEGGEGDERRGEGWLDGWG